MSVYVSVAGSVRMDLAAFAQLAARKTIGWAALTSQADDLHLRASDGHVVMEARGSFRNLGRCFVADLHAVAHAGHMRGAFEIICTDGTNSREVVTFDDDGMRYGSSDCLRDLIQLTAPNVVEHGFADMAAFVTDGEPTGVWVAASADALDQCACGGWDEDSGEPTCPGTATRHGERAVHELEWGLATGTAEETAGLLEEVLGDLRSSGELQALAGVGDLLMREVRDAPAWRELLERWVNCYSEVPDGGVEVRWARDCLWRTEDQPRWRPWPTTTGAGIYLTFPAGEHRGDRGPAGNSVVTLERDGYDRVLDTATALAADGMDPARALHSARLLTGNATRANP